MTAPSSPGPDDSTATDGVRVRPVAYLITLWPDGHACPASGHWCLMVTDRGSGRWAVEQGWSHGCKTVLTRAGQWAPDRRGDPNCRFTLDEALTLARRHASPLEAFGRHAARVIAEHTAKGCPE